MNRRELFRRAVIGTLAGGVAARPGLLAQRPAALPDSAAGDPLIRPDLVQQRSVATSNDNDPVVTGIEHKLKCTCGCNLDIYTCRTTDFTCQYSPRLHGEVLDLRAAGKDPDEVIAAFVAKYGEQILMAPPPEGFNLAGYLVPGAAVLVAGGLLAAVLLRRSRAAAVPAPAPAAPLSGREPSAADQEKLRRALEDVEA